MHDNKNFPSDKELCELWRAKQCVLYFMKKLVS